MPHASTPAATDPVLPAADPHLTGLSGADPAAFEEFFSVYFPRVYRWCLHRSQGPRAVAEAERRTEAILQDALRELETGAAAPLLAVQVLRAARRRLEAEGALRE